MAELLTKNSFHLLGLDTNATQKDINKRFKELGKYLSIGESPSYETDIWEFNGNRNIENIKHALHDLTDPRKKIVHYFFWFQIDDEKDVEAFKNICLKQYDNAIGIWSTGKSSPTHELYKLKNLAFLYCYLMFLDSGNKDKYLTDSISLWQSVFNLDKFWHSFEKRYLLHDDLDTQKEIITNFKKCAKSFLADIYVEISQVHSSYFYFEEFYKVFKVKGEKLEEDVLAPIYRKLNHVIDMLDSMNISEDGVMDDDETNAVKSSLITMQCELNKTIDLGLYNESQIRIIRDKAASSLRKISLDIYNNLWETEKANGLMEIAKKISGTESLRSKLHDENRAIATNKDTEPILELFQKKKYHEAMCLINKLETDNSGDSVLLEALKPYKKICITNVCVEDHKQANNLIDVRSYDDARSIYDDEITMIFENIELFELNKDAVMNMISRVKNVISTVKTRADLSAVDIYKNQLIDSLKQQKNIGESELVVLILLINAHIYSGLIPIFKKKWFF